MKRILISLIILFFPATQSVPAQAQAANAPAEQKPHVLLITIETLRADHLSCYGYVRLTTPTMDRLANKGILFRNMFVPRGNTWPSLTSIMTSLYPVNHGVRKNGHMLPSGIISLAEILKQNQYSCAAFISDHAKNGVWNGFDEKSALNDKFITKRAVKYIKRHADKSFFLWLHYAQPHDPYDPPEPYKSMFDPGYTGNIDGSGETHERISKEKTALSPADLNHIISLYDGCIRYVDDKIKEIWDTLETTNIADNTLFIITADHGENLYQPHFYFGHSASIYDDVLKVPFILLFPQKITQGARIDKIVENIDIAPTILDFLDIGIPRHFEGRSLLPLIYSKKDPGHFGFAYAEWMDKILSIRTETKRYIYNPEGYCPLANRVGKFIIEKEELHPIVNNYQEINNIIQQKPDIAEELKQKLFEWRNFKRWAAGYDKSADTNIPKDVSDHLKSLGYL